VISVHGLDLIFGNRKGPAARVYRALMAFAAKRRGVLTRILANSANTADIARRKGLGECRVVPLGVRMEEAPPADVDPTPFVLFVGRIVPRKGAGWFVEEVLPSLPEDTLLRVVGRPWDDAETARLEGHPRVEVLGRVEDGELARLRTTARAIVMPNVESRGETDVEGFGIAALEASASGTPLVASRLEGLIDAVRDGETGFLEPAGDADRWVARLRELLAWGDTERSEFAGRARRALAVHYTWSRVAEDTVAAYL
jgi:glycosyltransferase involved in cell wall biosynthesis